MKSVCMASMYPICGYHDNCPKSADTLCQYQKDKQDNTNYCKSKVDLPTEPQEKRRKVLRHSKKNQQDKNIETEGISYEKGSF